jgi:hypothetical protein
MSEIGWTSARPNRKIPVRVLYRSASVLQDPIQYLGARADDSFFRRPLLHLTLNDLEGAFFAFFVNERLGRVVDSISVMANEYLIWAASRDEFAVEPHDYTTQWPIEFDEHESREPWVRIRAKYGGSRFEFSGTTPCRLYDARRWVLEDLG